MVCPKCLRPVTQEQQYCSHCGEQIYLQQPTPRQTPLQQTNPQFSAQQNPNQKPKKKVAPLVIGGIVAVLAIFFVIGLLFGGETAIDMDMGAYTPKQENIVYLDEAESYGYVNNMILAFFDKSTKAETIVEIAKQANGEVVGVVPGMGQYQIEVPATSEAELETLRRELMTHEEVKYAVVDYVYTVEQKAYIPNDPWAENATWDESTPDGNNWWVEAAHIQSAWAYNDKLSHIDVGIVDNGFDTNHEDVNITVLNPDVASVEEHGTHVAGIIGATHNNGIGISGVVNRGSIYCMDCSPTDEQKAQQVTISSLLACIDVCATKGCRVINMSMGLAYLDPEQTADAARATAWNAVVYLILLRDGLDEEFLVVQSAGNAAVDAGTYNGYFASIDRELVREVFAAMEKDGTKLKKNITVDDVMNSFMVIGAVDKAKAGDKYQLSTFSNYGDAVTVCTPGVSILSTIPNVNNYALFNGTSMAAPIATGVTAMVWAANPDLSAEEVKEILVSTATETVLPRVSGDKGSYYIINAAAAVEEALSRKAENIPTEPPTQAPTEAPTQPPTQAPTEAPTQPPTQAPTAPPTEPPTEAPTAPPTQPPTEQPKDEVVVPDIATYLGTYQILTVGRKVTDGATKAVSYWTTYGVKKEYEQKLYTFMELLEAYGFEQYEETKLNLTDKPCKIYAFRHTNTTLTPSFENAGHYFIVISEKDANTFCVDVMIAEGIQKVKVKSE